MVFKKNIIKKYFVKDGKSATPSLSFFKLFKYSTRWEKFLMIIASICCVITGIATTLNIYNFANLAEGMIVYGLATYENITINDTNAIKHTIHVFCINQAGIAIGNILFKYFAVTLFNYTASEQILRIKGKLFKAILSWDISWYDTNETGDLSGRLNGDMAKLDDGIGEKVAMFLHYIATFVVSLGFSFISGWELAIVTISLGPLILACLILMTSISAKYTKKGIEAYAKAGVIAEEVISSIRTVFAFGGQELEANRYKANLIDATKISQKRDFYSAMANGIQWLFIQILNAIGFWYGAHLIVQQRHLPVEEIVYTPRVMILVFYAITMGLWNIAISSLFLDIFGMAKAAGAKIFNLIEQDTYIGNRDTGLRPASCFGNISFQNIFFKYPSRPDVVVLDGLSMTVKRGEKVAIVGPSGCGKSTCIQLLQRLYDTSRGEILLDGINIKKINVNWLRENIGAVGQEPVLFATTIYENIRYGKETATQKEIEEAAKIANAHNFIKNLPMGYNTLVGERGAQLSGGQKQRIAIARAIIRNPTILLLDEATSALDSTSETKVQRALDKACKGRTTIVVAHRLSTIMNADKIVVIDKGKVIEMGVHHDLMMQRKAYYNLVISQLGDIPEADLQIVPSIDEIINNEDDDDTEHTPVLVEEPAQEKIEKVTLWELIKYNKPEWVYIVIGTVGAILAGTILPLSSVIFGALLGVLSSPDDEYVLEQTDKYCFCYCLIAIGSGFFTFLQIYMMGIAGERLTERIRGLVFTSVLKQDIAWFDDKRNGTGTICSRLSGDAAALQGATGQRIGTIVQGMGVIMCSVALAFYYEWSMGLIVLSFAPVIVLGMVIEKKIRYKEQKAKVKSMDMSTKLAVEVISNIRTVVSLGRQNEFYEDYMKLLQPAIKRIKVNMHIRGFLYGITSSLTYIVVGPVVLYGGTLIYNNNVHYSVILKTLRAIALTVVVIANASAFSPNIIRGIEAASNIFAIIKRTPKIVDKTNPNDFKFREKPEGIVEFSAVDFSYPAYANNLILQDLTLNATKGQSIALVGESGCGKSTCIQLLERFYDPNSGKIMIDDRNIQDESLANLRSQIGIVLQEPVVFNRSVRDNIAYGDNSRKVHDNEIIAAARQANIHNFISSLPTGYDTKLGNKGAQLSGGQKQRIAIARALIRNPKILLLDEATSALDFESEKIVQEALNEAKKGRTCITIAHRLQTIRDADIIFVIKSGKIVEKGTHSELYEQKGVYYELCKMQCMH